MQSNQIRGSIITGCREANSLRTAQMMSVFSEGAPDNVSTLLIVGRAARWTLVLLYRLVSFLKSGLGSPCWAEPPFKQSHSDNLNRGDSNVGSTV